VPRRRFRILSWNVNGIRAAEKKGFGDWLAGSKADVIGIQEVRARGEQISEALRSPRCWNTHFVHAERPGYSGVGLYSRAEPDHVETALGHRLIDAEGRLQIARFGKLWIVNGYFPNGSGKERDNSRVPFKLRFYQRLRKRLKPAFDAGEPIVVMGDFNTAPDAIDLARPKQNAKTSGFLPEERAELARWLKAGWVDSFRHQNDEPGHYTWWSQRFGVREKNIGWRIDLALVSPGALPHLRKASIHPDVRGSDHCPIGVDFDRAVLGS